MFFESYGGLQLGVPEGVFYMVEYCFNFKIAFSKVQDFLSRLKFTLKLPLDIKNESKLTEKVETVIECYFLILDL